jgi:hypothetical protein
VQYQHLRAISFLVKTAASEEAAFTPEHQMLGYQETHLSSDNIGLQRSE